MISSFLVLFGSSLFFFAAGLYLATSHEKEGDRLPARRIYYGSHAALLSFLPPFLLLLLFYVLKPLNLKREILLPLVPLVSIGFGGWALYQIRNRFHARHRCERILKYILRTFAFTAILVTALILLSLLVETIRFFLVVSPLSFFFSTEWAPDSSLLSESGPSGQGTFGILPLLAGTLLITAIALAVAAPLGLLTSVYLSEFSSPRRRNVLKPLIEILAGIPTIVYGFFAIVTVMPFLHQFGIRIGIEISPQSALGVGLIMGIMVLPLIASLSDDALQAVPLALRENALALGATPAEMIKGVALPAAMPGILASILLAVARAIGETMLVVMAAGLMAHLTLNPFQSVTTITVQIVSLLTGDQEFSSPKTLSAFALGTTLFFLTLCLNLWALRVVRKHREKYEQA